MSGVFGKWIWRRRVPSVLQLEAVECGAACLGMVLAHHGADYRLERLRELCGVSRDGAKASGILNAARSLGMVAKGFKVEMSEIRELQLPAIIFCRFQSLRRFGDYR